MTNEQIQQEAEMSTQHYKANPELQQQLIHSYHEGAQFAISQMQGEAVAFAEWCGDSRIWVNGRWFEECAGRADYTRPSYTTSQLYELFKAERNG